MTWIIAGLGNPGEKYDNTRHNTGRMALESFAKAQYRGEWKKDAKSNALVARGALNGSLFVLVLPETFMNKSGSAVAKYCKSMKSAERFVVVYDDLDLPLGAMKISFNRGSGGHKGVESIIRAVKTKKFWRIRIGVSNSTAAGVIKKPQGEQAVNDFILGKFKAHEAEQLRRVFTRARDALEMILTESAAKAMNKFN